MLTTLKGTVSFIQNMWKTQNELNNTPDILLLFNLNQDKKSEKYKNEDKMVEKRMKLKVFKNDKTKTQNWRYF